MSLQYDFDIAPGADGSPAARFRDPATIDALRRADPRVQEYFRASGFEMTTFDSGVGAGRYPEKDEAARAEIIARLSENMKLYPIKGLDFGGFEFPNFLATLSKAEPVGAAAPKVVVKDTTLPDELRAPRPRPTGLTEEDARMLLKARADAKRAQGMRTLALGILMAGVALLIYVTTQLFG